MLLNKEQINQDIEYSFPYHHVPQFKNGFVQNYNWTWSLNYISTVEFILAQIKKDNEKICTIADVGCGDGRLTKEIHDMFTDKKVIGIDYSSRAINLAKALNPDIDYKNVDIINDKNIGKFDAITLIEVFEHIPIDMCNHFIKSLDELLVNDGIIYFTVPHKNKKVGYKHFQHFDLESLKKYFEDYFIIEEVVYFEKITRWNKIIKFPLNNNFFISNNRQINDLIYKLYKKFFVFTNESNAGRVYLKLRKIPNE